MIELNSKQITTDIDVRKQTDDFFCWFVSTFL